MGVKLTKGQARDLATIEYFMYPGFTGETASPCGAIESEDGVSPERAFFDHSDKGVSLKGRAVRSVKRLEQLLAGKRWRGVHVGMYEEGVLDGSVPYSVLLEGMPEEVVDFMKREMFKGVDADLIDRIAK